MLEQVFVTRHAYI